MAEPTLPFVRRLLPVVGRLALSRGAADVKCAAMKAPRQSGFTLWELLVTMLVAGMLLAVGVPSFRDAQRNSAITAAANDLITGLLAARAEAVKRQVPVTLCASPDPAAAESGLRSGRRGREWRLHRLGRLGSRRTSIP